MFCSRLNERGGILVLVAILIVALISVIGLYVDMALLASGRTKQNFVADYAALGALEAYLAAEVTDPGFTGDPGNPFDVYNYRVDRGLEAARRTGGTDENFLTLERLDPTPSRTPDAPLDLSASPNSYGRLIPGRWFSAASCSPACPAFPCTATPNKSCFQPNGAGDTIANAMQVELKLPSNDGFLGRFINLFNPSAHFITSRSIATMTPRRLEFLIDASPSVAQGSHLPSQVQFSMKLNSTSASCNSPTPRICNCSALGALRNPCQTGTCDFEDTTLNARWNALSASRKDDFACQTVTYHKMGVPITENYLIDTEVPPEPYTSIMVGVHSALQEMEDRAVTGDRVGAIFFDMEDIDERKFSFVSADPGNASFAKLKTITDIAAGNPSREANLLLGVRDHLSVPRYQSFPVVNTDVPKALMDGRAEIVAMADAANVENSVVLFSDGLSICWDTSIDPMNPVRSSVVCNNSYNDLQLSLDEVTTKWASILARDGIAAHVFLFGTAALAPHTLVRTSAQNPNICMTDDEVRTTAGTPPPFVDFNLPFIVIPGVGTFPLDALCYPTEGVIPATPECAGVTGYVYPNRLYDLALQTAGLYVPLRTPCSWGGAGSCSEGVRTLLDSACATPPPGVKFVPGYSDANGRLLCDADCRAGGAQASDALARILGTNPYVLVAE